MVFRKLIILFISTFGFSVFCAAQESLIDEVDKKLLDSLIVQAKRNYPRIKFYQARTDASKQNLKKQKLGWLEPLTFSYVLQPSSGAAVNATNPVFLNGYQFGLFVNVGSLLERPAIINQAKKELKVFEYEQEEYDLTITAEIKKRYYNYLHQETILKMQTKTLLDSKAMLQDITQRYEKSEISFEEYSKVLIVYNSHIQSKLETEGNLLTAISQIEELTGTDFIAEKKKNGIN